MYEAKMIADSVSPAGKRLPTMALVYPRYIHAEFMTHRVFSRNASSSRAVPVAKMVDMALTEMVEPIRWGKNIAGMQAADEDLTGRDLMEAKLVWRRMAEYCAEGARRLAELGLHKQWANRPLEWFGNIRVLVTATEWDGFFALRDHPDAQPEIQHLARLMKQAMDGSTPRLLQPGEWHLPYITDEERATLPIGLLVKVSAARCCRVSYLKHDGTFATIAEELALFERLASAEPMHASPFEHQATPDFVMPDSAVPDDLRELVRWMNPGLHGNLVGWIQHRKLLEQGIAL